MTDDAHADVSALNFEDALKQLEEIVARLEGGDVPLEESIAIYERGAKLRAHCETRLKAAQERVDAISGGGDGPVTTVPLDGENGS